LWIKEKRRGSKKERKILLVGYLVFVENLKIIFSKKKKNKKKAKKYHGRKKN
jgi:hypothetical protein